jgi:hypothetical protein
MEGFTTTETGEWVFNLADPESKPTLPEGPNMATSYLSGPGKWENYSDKDLYEVESLLLQFFDSVKDQPAWKQQNPRKRRFTCGMIFEIIYGKVYDVHDKDDQRKIRRLATVMTYYSTKKQKEGSINGKYYKKTIYTLSPKLLKTRPPYSLKLRIPWLEERGKLPCWQNMRLPKDDLEAGHARNKKTDRNMELRRERARQKYNERYKHRPR